MNEVKLTKEELIKMKEVYRSIMAYASIGLFLKNGEIIAEVLMKEVNRDKYFEDFGRVLKERGWVDDIEFSEEEVKVKGSIEVTESKAPTCHILRGIIRKIYEVYYETLVSVEEQKCESMGDEYCLFKISMVR